MHIESRPSCRRKSEFEILVDVECDNKRMEQLTGMLKREVAAINLATFESGAEVPPPTPMSATASFGESVIFHARFIAGYLYVYIIFQRFREVQVFVRKLLLRANKHIHFSANYYQCKNILKCICFFNVVPQFFPLIFPPRSSQIISKLI